MINYHLKHLIVRLDRFLVISMINNNFHDFQQYDQQSLKLIQNHHKI